MPKILSLDDEVATEGGFFDRKTEEAKLQNIKRNAQMQPFDINQNEVAQRFMKLGLKEELIQKWCEEALSEM